MNHLPLRNFFGFGRLVILLTLGITLLLSALLFSMRNQSASASVINIVDRPDMLAYVSDDNHLILYNPRDRTETTVLNNVNNFLIGRDGRIAFTKLDEDDSDIYVFDPSTPAIAPHNISQNPTASNYPLAWSPDGHYLAFASFSESSNYSNDIWIYQGGYLAGSGEQSLYVWDSETTVNIMPDNDLDTAVAFNVNWSQDGQLAFTVRYGWSNLDTASEIYIWDGDITINLSQNPLEWDGGAMWSRSGRLMFASTRDEETGIYVWDGISFDDEVPDRGSFIRIAPDLNTSYATWLDTDLIGLTTYSDSGGNEILLWDLEDEAIVKRLPVSSENAWSWLSSDGQMILSSHLASGIPSSYLDIENIEGEILFSTHTGEFSWSSSGYLAYCGIDEGRSRLLSIWDGEETWLVTRVSYKPIQWQNGQDTFSCNDG
jgi:WD40-like Beta Propeller Repeat